MLLEPTDGEAVHGRFSLSHLHPCNADEQAPTPDPYTHAHTHTHTPALEVNHLILFNRILTTPTAVPIEQRCSIVS
jgi:hypothetical protein